MRSLRPHIFSIFSLVFVLLGVSGIYTSGAATMKYKAPSAPSNVKAVGGLNKAILTWNVPSSNGGKAITSYKVVIYLGAKAYVCKSSKRRCVVPIVNPNKPSPKPVPVRYAFTVAATNSIGTGPASTKTAYVSVRFRATIYIAPKYGTASPTPTPIPIPTRTCTATTTFDGSYSGTAVVTVTTPASTLGASSNIATTFAVLNGRGDGKADNWTIDGCVTDPLGSASVTVSDLMYGSLTFNVFFTQDPVTKVMSGNGKGMQTVSYPNLGDITIEFVFNVSKGGTS